VRRAAAALACAALLGGCRGLQSALDPAGDQAATIDLVWRLMLVVCGAMFALVLAFLAWALVRARRAAPAPAPVRGRALAAALYGWIGLILTGLFALGIGSFVADRRLTAAPAGDVLHVRITGQQWWWQVEYPDDADPSRSVMTANELHLPLGRTADIELRTQDVIHSLWIPNLAGKQDLIPGRVNHLRVTPRRGGALRGQCAEFCGLQHAWMALDVRVEAPEAFEAWRARQLEPAKPPATPQAQEGARVFAGSACPLCHAIAGSDAAARTGPDLTHVASRATLAAGALPFSREALRAWLADPQRYKPGAHMPAVPLGAEQRERLVDYLMTLE
jgi:cytochrome c oxidase subunit 2